MARRSMSKWDLEAWISAGEGLLVGARIDNIYEDEGVFIFKVKPAGEEARLLVVEPGRRVHFSRRTATPPSTQPKGFLAILRKYCRGQRIVGVRQLSRDRVLRVELASGYSLVAELLPRGLLVLVDPEGAVKGASRYVEMRDRTVKPKVGYEPPPLDDLDPLGLSPGEALSLVRESRGRDVVRGLVRGLRIPGEVAEEALYRAGIDKGSSIDSLGEGLVEAILEELRRLKQESLEGKGFIGITGGQPVEAVPFRPTRMEYREYESFDDALDDFFSMQVAGEEGLPELERLLKSMEEARMLAEDYRRRARELRSIAERLSANYHSLERVLECARRGDPLSCPGVAGFDRARGRIVVEVAGGRVEADPREGPDRLIIRLFREAGELESKARRAEKALKEYEVRARELELKAQARRIALRLKSRERRWFERYHWTVTTNGFLAVGGRDAGQNESVVRKYLGPDDVFIHADIHGAPAVVLLTRGRSPGEEDIVDAAHIAAAYSKAWRAGMASVGVYWVRGEQVSKSPPAGEYLARGGFMVYGKRNYLDPLPLRLYIGIALDNEGLPVVVQGSRAVVSRISIAYSELVPGDLKVEEASEAVKTGLAEVLPRDMRALAIAIDKQEIASRIPGKSRITGFFRGSGEGLFAYLRV